MENDNPQKKKLKIASILTLFIFLFDIYIIVNIPKNYILLIISALLTLVFVLLLLENWFEWKNQQERELERQYIDIIKMERTAHTASQKKLQDIDDKINFIGQKIMPLERSAHSNQKQIATMLEALMEGQKKVAKITVSRSKENANIIINSNEQLLNQMNELLQSIMETKQELITSQNNSYQQKENEIQKNKIEEPKKIENNSSELEEPKKIEESSPELEEPKKIEESSPELEEPKKIEESSSELEEPKKVETISEEISKIPKLNNTVHLENVNQKLDSKLDSEFVNKQSSNISDPNKIMNPEDIAALIANTSVEELPKTTIKIEEEEKPPMPDMSDPNKVMSPEDIAALIANM